LFWHRKHEALKGFWEFAIRRGYTDRSPVPVHRAEEYRQTTRETDPIKAERFLKRKIKHMFTPKSAEGYWDKHFRLSKFAALGEFSLRDYRGREMGKSFGDAYIEGVEQGFCRGGRRGDAETGSLSFYIQFHCAQHLELSESFFNG
jgi:hypothetical protein